MAFTKEQNLSVRNTTGKMPYLWVSDILAGQPLKTAFPHIFSPAVPPESIPVGDHILCFDSDTPELIWRAIAYDLLAVGCKVEVYQPGHFSKQPLEWYLSDGGGVSVIAPDILINACSYQDWEELQDSKLSLKQALELAEVVLLKVSDRTQVNIALDALRRRAEVSEYNWEKKHLKAIREKLKRLLALPCASQDGSNGKVIQFLDSEPQSIEQVTEKIDELVATGATGSHLTGQLNRLATASQFYVGELRKLYYERLEESDLECERSSYRDEVDNLLKLTDQTLDLADYLPKNLALPLTNWCGWLSIRPAVALTALLVGASSLHKVGTELIIHRNKNFGVPPTLFAAFVAESGQLKSPVYSNVIRQPLNKLRQEKVEAHKAAMENYEAAMQAWEQSQKKGKKPKKPADPTLYFFTNATGEAIPVQASKVPDKALLALIDELAGLFKSENAYRGGRGSDKQDLLSYFDGTGQTVLRASGVKVDVEQIYLSIFGTIQPLVLKNHMKDCSDPDGQWARFLFVNQPLAFAPLGDDDGQAVSIRSRIADFYRNIERIPEMEYRLSRAAFKRYELMHDQLEHLRVTHQQPGMRAVYSKMKGIIGRLALNLHVLWELDSGKACPSEEIPLFIMEMAISLAKFYIGQIKLVHADSDHESLPTHVVKLIELSKRLEANDKDGWIKAQMYRDQFDSKKRPSAQQARDWMNEAVTLGYGRTRGSGNRLEYYWLSDNNKPDNNPPSPDNLGKLREDLGKTLPVVTTIENKGVEDNLGNLGNLGKDTPNLSLNKLNGCTPDQSDEKSSLEGGSVPEPSLSSPQESCKVNTLGDTDLGNNLGKGFPKFPEVPQVCDSFAPESVTEEVAMGASHPAFGIAPATVAPSPAVEGQDNEDLMSGKAVGRRVHTVNIRKEVSGESWKIVKWCERHEIYILENGENFPPFQLVLAKINQTGNSSS